MYNVLGWCSPIIKKVKILSQRVWESGVDWDQEIPQNITEEWLYGNIYQKNQSILLSQGCYNKGTPVAWIL